ncbi:ABC transporter ATP-binding protein [Protaetiibacter larvae]|uniref:ABC transporter ATP-binding protein n=1 Tax=Protaetiibacter larvae TaxID=2592654 RepID=A0A5C1Y5Z6_9MICO|nr:ABC transporter ATP-binding protein [Protaetiibacter larvae]QEO09463.1 ABC transporter ATP-binding protein [Protaetiibacter larvae]
MTALAELDAVTRRYGNLVALDEVSLAVDEGRILGLLGPNGAGKTTLLSLVAGLIRPTSGTVRLFGRDPRDAAARVGLGTTPQETALPAPLKVGEVIDFVGGHFPDRVPTAELAAEFGLEELLRRQTGSLSGGQRRRLSVALAFVGRPKLVLLDEPTTGLDVDGRHVLWGAIRRQREAGAAIVVTSHYLEEIEALAERVAVVTGGRIAADGELATIIANAGTRWASLTSAAPDRVAALPEVAGSRIDGDHVELSLHDADAFVRALVASALPFTGLQLRSATLEEAFLSIVKESAA